MTAQLPAEFAALEPFAAQWAISGSVARAAARGKSTAAEREAFYAAAKDLLTPALAYLDARKLDQFNAAETRLMDMMLSLAHVALAVEGLGDDEPRHATMRQHMHIIRTPAGV
jgi:hypothetical protein